MSSIYENEIYDNRGIVSDDKFQKIKGAWHMVTSRNFKKYSTLSYDVECWTHGPKFKNNTIIDKDSVKYRFFNSIVIHRKFSLPLLMFWKIFKMDTNQKVILEVHGIYNFFSYIIILLSRFKNFKIFAQHHGDRSAVFKSPKYFNSNIIKFIRLIERNSLNKLNGLFSLHEKHKISLKKAYPDLPVFNLTMSPEDYHFTKIDKNKAREELNYPPKKSIIIYIGRLVKIKGIEFLLESMKRLPNVELKIIGHGPQLFKLKEKVSSDKLNNVEFLGKILGREKLIYLSASDVFVLPSLREGFSVAVLEALAQNVPVVSTNVGGILDLKKKVNSLVVVNPGSASDLSRGINVLLNKDMDKSTSEVIRENYSWEAVIAKRETYYKGLK